MRNNMLVITAVAVACSTPMMTASAQTVGVAPGGSVVVEDAPGIATEQWRPFREYVVRERTPDYAIPGRVAVGTILPTILGELGHHRMRGAAERIAGRFLQRVVHTGCQ